MVNNPTNKLTAWFMSCMVYLMKKSKLLKPFSFMEQDKYNKYKGKAYRFLSFDGLFQTIIDQRLRYTRVDQLNDPLDNSPLMLPFSFEKHDIKLHSFILQKLFDDILKSMYICSFSKHYEKTKSYLMWSHYAESHSQVCFEIDFTVNTSISTPSNVTYPKNLANERDKLKHSKDKISLFVVTNKAKIWKYEDEVRLIIDILKPNQNFEKLNFSNDCKYIYQDIDLSLISKVIFGIKSEKANIVKTIALFKVKGFNPIYEQMYIDPKTLKFRGKILSI